MAEAHTSAGAGETSFLYELTAPRTLELRELAAEETPLRAHEVAGQTQYSLTSTGTELAAWVGKPPLRPSKAYPRLMGYCNVARVTAVGSEVRGIEPGSFVLTHEAHRSHIRVADSAVLYTASGLADDQVRALATTYLYHLAYSALLGATYVPGHQVAVIGLGALGFTTASLVHAFGGTPFVFSDRGAGVLSGALPLATMSPKGPDARLPENVMAALGGADIVVNTSDSWSDYDLALRLARRGGTIVLLGFPGRGQGAPASNPLDSRYMYDKQLALRQVGHVSDGAYAPIDVRFTLARNIGYLYSLIQSGRVDPSPLLTLRAPWRELADAYDTLSSRRAGHFAALVDWTC